MDIDSEEVQKVVADVAEELASGTGYGAAHAASAGLQRVEVDPESIVKLARAAGLFVALVRDFDQIAAARATEPELALRRFQEDVWRNAAEHGWSEIPLVYGDGSLNASEISSKLALTHSELSEALEEVRAAKTVHGLREARKGQNGKPEGFGSELADAMLRILDLAARLRIDLQAAMQDKHAFNRTRPYKHGGKSC